MSWIAALYAWACLRLYDEFAWSYDAVSWIVSLGRWSRWRRYALAHISGTTILELGFGTGRLMNEMAHQGLSVTGLDLSPAMGAIAAHHSEESAAAVTLVQGDARALPFVDGHFDSIVATFPAPYILEPDTLSEIVRVMRAPTEAAGGRLVIVGLWAALQDSRLRSVCPVFYGRPSPAWLDRLADRFRMCGMSVQIGERSDGLASVGVLVAEVCRRSDDD